MATHGCHGIIGRYRDSSIVSIIYEDEGAALTIPQNAVNARKGSNLAPSCPVNTARKFGLSARLSFRMSVRGPRRVGFPSGDSDSQREHHRPRRPRRLRPPFYPSDRHGAHDRASWPPLRRTNSNGRSYLRCAMMITGDRRIVLAAR
jgi:hypothetical protein